MRALTAFTVLVMLLAGCSDSDSGGEATRPADEARADQVAADANHHDIGDPADLGNGLTATVTSIDGTDTTSSGDTVVLAQVRVENTGDTDAWPEYAIFCAGTTTWPTGTDSGMSTIDPSASVPPGSFVEGTVAVHVPNHYGDPGPCTSPAWIDIRDSTLTGTNAAWAIPDTLLPLE